MLFLNNILNITFLSYSYSDCGYSEDWYEDNWSTIFLYKWQQARRDGQQLWADENTANQQWKQFQFRCTD